MSKRDHGVSKAMGADGQLRQEAAVLLTPEVAEELAHILQRRESTERAVQRLDLEVYELESAFLKHCVSHGGSLFDGFGLERHAGAHRSPIAVLTPLATPLATSPAALVSAGFDVATGSAPGSPLRSAAGGEAQARTYRVLSDCFGVRGGAGAGAAVSGCGAADDAVGVGAPSIGSVLTAGGAVLQVGSKGPSAPAFAYRIHFFSPSERVFSACSIGALSRVEVAKSTLADVRGVSTSSAWLTTAAAAAAAAGRGGGLGKRGRGGRGGAASALTNAFDRQPDAPPSRRRQRPVKEEEEDEDDGYGRTGGGTGESRRRRLHHGE
ncbi:Histone acetyltransferase subunit NuA4 [Novymonas esmeraldas]|uniref:Histone acetyltransferase subunit NuA4 n=1 Tax=Novymonas esmeraldas TaxID=1808958 RepID=A0AAW0EM49_9TRYP